MRSARRRESSIASEGSNAQKRARAGLARAIERLLGMLEQHLSRAAVTRCDDAADAQAGMDRSGVRLKGRLRHRLDQTKRGDLHLLVVAGIENKREFVAGMTGDEHLRRAFARANAQQSRRSPGRQRRSRMCD